MEIRLLRADEIECRVGTIKTNGCTLLLYKDARVDMKILDETFGTMGWQRTHEVINNNLFCNIEIWDEAKKQWVKKQDVGTESFTEKEKGEASDSFKRAGFNVGIGRELYTSPFIWVTPKDDKEFVEKDNKVSTRTRFSVKTIGYDKDRNINELVIVDDKGIARFSLASNGGIDLLEQFNNLVRETDTDLEAILTKCNVSSTAKMTSEQLKSAINFMNKLKNKKE